MNRELHTRFFERLAFAVCLLGFVWLAVGAFGEEPGRPRLYNDWEITERTPLLDADGGLAAWGWARRPLMTFDRGGVPESSRPRYKEWDFYCVTSPDAYIEITLANISWAVLASVSFVDYRTKERSSNLHFGHHINELILPPDPYGRASYDKTGRRVAFGYAQGARTLEFDFPETFLVGPRMRGRIRIQDDPQHEQLATAMPFDDAGSFFYTNKMVAMPASGTIEVGDKSYAFDSARSFAVLDWGRGVWPHEFEWGWAAAAGMVDGKRLGFNIGFGDEDNSRTSGNSLVFDGILHKLGTINWTWAKDDVMQPWLFKSEDGRFEVVLEPFFDQSGALDLGKYYAKLGKAHGMVSGRIVLDNGAAVEFAGIRGFAEHAVQRW